MSGVEQSPTGPSEKEIREANDFCEDIIHATELRESAERLLGLSRQAASKVIHQGLSTRMPFELAITVPEGVEAAVISDDDDVLEAGAEAFIATEVRSISQHGLEFYNRDSRTRIIINGFRVEVAPVLPEFADPDYTAELPPGLLSQEPIDDKNT